MGMLDGPAPVLSATTVGERETERFDSFRDALCAVYLGILPERTSPVTFDADVLAYDWDGAILSRIRAPGHGARRNASSLARVPDDALFINVSPDSAARLDHLGQRWRMPPGAPVLLDNAQPFDLEFDPRRRFRPPGRATPAAEPGCTRSVSRVRSRAPSPPAATSPTSTGDSSLRGRAHDWARSAPS
jgi:hypothetical protein